MVGIGLVILVAVGWQNLIVRQENRVIAAALTRNRAEAISPGDWIGELTGVTLGGNYARYQTADDLRPSLIVGMSVDCGFCEQNLERWRTLSSEARRLGAQVVWVSRDLLRRGTSLAGTDRNLITEPTHATYVQLKLSLVPQTLVTQSNGTVIYAHAGILNASMEQDIIKTIMAALSR